MTHKVDDDFVDVKINQYTLFWRTVQLQFKKKKKGFKCTYSDPENPFLEMYLLDIPGHFYINLLLRYFYKRKKRLEIPKCPSGGVN